MIPVDKDTSMQHNQLSKPSSPLEDTHDQNFPASTSTLTSPPSASSNKTVASSLDDINNSILSPEEESKKSILDFLGKIDSTLAKTKSYVKNR